MRHLTALPLITPEERTIRYIQNDKTCDTAMNWSSGSA